VVTQCKFKDCEEEAGDGYVMIGPGYIGPFDYLDISLKAPLCDFHTGLLAQADPRPAEEA
jgi:hypothetical protein